MPRRLAALASAMSGAYMNEFFQKPVCREEEYPGIPEKIAAGEIALGALCIGLLDELGNWRWRVRVAGPYVAVAGVRRGWHNAERHQRTVLRVGYRCIDAAPEGLRVGDDVIGRHYQHRRIAKTTSPGTVRCQRNRRRRIATRWLNNQIRLMTDLRKLAGNQIAVRSVTNNQRTLAPSADALEATQRRLNHRVRPRQRQELLW